VRLPTIPDSVLPTNKGSHDPDPLKTRSNSEYVQNETLQSKPPPQPTRSSINSSKPSMESVLSEILPMESKSRYRRDFTPTSTSSNDIDSEWLLLRENTLNEPPRASIQVDKYAHIHPLLRKYAGNVIPEIKMREPRVANAVMSRRWQEEETLQRDKREYLAQLEQGVELPSAPATCMTKEEEFMSRVAEETLMLLKEFDNQNIQENIDNASRGKQN